MRHRQGAFRVVDGVPYPDGASTMALLPTSLVGRWLASPADRVRGGVLDVGAGQQPFRPWYEPLADQVVAVDVVPAPGLAVQSYAVALPFADDSFDALLCTSVLEHVDDIERSVAEISRVVRPGGAVLVTAPFLYPTHEAPYDYWRTTHFGLVGLLERHGLVVEDVAAQGGPFLLVSHYALGGLGAAVSRAGSRGGRLGRLVDNRWVRSAVVAPQEAVRTRTSYRLTRLSRAASLGYMVMATVPGGDEQR